LKTTLQALTDALKYSAQQHRNQRRKDAEASPYLNHPIDLLHHLVHVGGIMDPVVLCAAVLHDTIEDTGSRHQELADRFGRDVADVVQEVTDDKSLPKAERKLRQIEHAATISDPAKLVKLADKYCNVRDVLRSPPAAWTEQRKSEYIDWSSQVVDELRGVHPHLEAAFDDLLGTRPGRLSPP
jgi:guanosine-3',5'-bis(diphosphate) 3'-pyrophosphohydrolase